MIAINDVIALAYLIVAIVLFVKISPMRKHINTAGNHFLRITVIIPARNEAHNIGNLLGDLQVQSLLPYQIICVDDGSTDKTSEIIYRFDVEKVEVSYLPEHWRGKTWACQAGAQRATGDVLLFIDADVRLDKTAIERLALLYAKNEGPVSVQPYHTMRKFYELFSLFFNHIQVAATGIGLPKVCSKGMFGPIFMISKHLFDCHKGFDVVKSEIIEDFSLGRYYDDQGIPTKLALGGDIISFRMYPNGFASLLEGWVKNFSHGALATKWWLLFMIIVWLTGLTVIPIELINAVVAAEIVHIVIYGAIYLYSVLLLYRTGKMLGTYPFWCCVVYPFFLAAFHLIFLYSTFASFLFKSTTWKGRRL